MFSQVRVSLPLPFVLSPLIIVLSSKLTAPVNVPTASAIVVTIAEVILAIVVGLVIKIAYENNLY